MDDGSTDRTVDGARPLRDAAEITLLTDVDWSVGARRVGEPEWRHTVGRALNQT